MSLARGLLLASIMLLGAAGCGGSSDRSPLSEQVGQNCTVQFRRGDALGGGGSLPVSPTTGGINGAEVSLFGKLTAVSRDWITLERAPKRWVIPRESILLVEFESKQ